MQHLVRAHFLLCMAVSLLYMHMVKGREKKEAFESLLKKLSSTQKCSILVMQLPPKDSSY
jgi:hypothetical protein